MIIKCNNCNKNFEVDASLIPNEGRLLQCNACDHKWFFKKKIIEKSAPIVKIKASSDESTTLKDDVRRVETENPKNIQLLDSVTENVYATEEISIQNNNKTEEIINEDKELNFKKFTNKKNYNILGLTIVFIMSFIALFVIFDTFQKPISIFIPNIEFLLYSMYETINDIVLFFRDLV